MTDYLWDRSGEPDEEIQKLEELLAPMAYQPRPLVIPATLQPGRRRNLYPFLAIAAAVALAALALGVWLNINRDAAVAPQKAEVITPAAVEKKDTPELASGPDKTVAAPKASPGTNRRPVHSTPSRRNQLARNERRNRKGAEPQREMTAAAALEAEAGKEQLMLALRLASSKLTQAQKRAQGGYPANQIRNQHKVG